jgi:tripartite-type tricarboxylate transporter receptor subunit TctC
MTITKYGTSCWASSRIALVVALLLGFHTTYLNAQEYPTKPVRVVASGAAGSLSDSLAWLIFAKVSETLGQQFIVDNRAGAGGTGWLHAAVNDQYRHDHQSVLVLETWLRPLSGL